MITEIATHQLQNNTILAVDREETEGEPTLFAATMFVEQEGVKIPLCMFSSPFQEMVDSYVKSVLEHMGSYKVH